MNYEQKKEFITYLSEYTTQNKLDKMVAVLQGRTRHVTLVLEDLFQPHNASAILRSAECFGIQDIHIIEKRNQFRATEGVAMGAAKWLDLHYYPAINDCFAQLKSKGYTIVATTPGPQAIPLQELPLNNKMALVFGTELTGLTSQALEHADLFVTIPMYGFTQSFNVSVSSALCLYQITESLKRSSIPWHLTPQEQQDITLAWLKRNIRGYAGLEKVYRTRSTTQ